MTSRDLLGVLAFHVIDGTPPGRKHLTSSFLSESLPIEPKYDLVEYTPFWGSQIDGVNLCIRYLTSLVLSAIGCGDRARRCS